MAKKVNRRLPSVTAPIQKKKHKGAPKKRLTAAEKKAARMAYKQYKKHRSGADKKFDMARAQFRAKKRKGFKNKPGPKLRVAAKVGTLNRKAGALRNKLKKAGKLGKKDAAALKGLTSSAKKKYSANRKRIQAVAKQKAHDIVGKAMVDANKLMAAAKKTGNKKVMAAAKKKAEKLMTVANNKAVRVINDTRRDLTSMRKAAGRNHGGRKPGPKPKVAVGGKGAGKHSLDMGIRPNRKLARAITGRGRDAARAASGLFKKAAGKFDMGARPNRKIARQVSGRGMQIRKAKANKAMTGVGTTMNTGKKPKWRFLPKGSKRRVAAQAVGAGAATLGAGVAADKAYSGYKKRQAAKAQG